MTLSTGLFGGSVLAVLYVLGGYPALLGWLARRRAKPVRKSSAPPCLVSIVLPVRNGEQWIIPKLQSIRALNYPQELLQIIVISDGSQDRTDELIRNAAASTEVELVRIPASGKAAALNAGLQRARGEILFFTDVRQPLEPDCLRQLVDCFSDPEVGAASGELIIRKGQTREEADIGLYWRYEKWIRVRLSRLDSVLGATGAIYAMRRHLATPMPPETLLDDVYLPLAAFFQGYRVIFDSSAVAFDFPTSLDTEFGRKVRTQAGVYQMLRYYPQLLGPANRMWLHFVSHKLGRLLLPYLLLTIAGASFGLPGWSATLALSGQAIVYGLAAIDRYIPNEWPLKRLSSPSRTFVVLMAAAALAAGILFMPSRAFWKSATGSASGPPRTN
jgi:biofilm PGA synthesis N-glycosyltransferase PgaC